MKSLRGYFSACVVLCVGNFLGGMHSGDAQTTVTDNFSTNPLTSGAWGFGYGSNANNQWNYVSGSDSYLEVALNSALPASKLDLSIGSVLDSATAFRLSVDFSFSVISAPEDQYMQMGFGLSHSALTGSTRIGPGMVDSFNTVEFNYFPNVAFWGGPTLSPSVFGGYTDEGGFGNYSSLFGSDSDLGDNTGGQITELPQDLLLRGILEYDGAGALTLRVGTVGSGGVFTEFLTGLPVLNLTSGGAFDTYDPENGFLLDSISLFSYHDGYTIEESPSLDAVVRYHQVTLEVIPEAGTGLLVSLALLFGAGARSRSRRKVA